MIHPEVKRALDVLVREDGEDALNDVLAVRGILSDLAPLQGPDTAAILAAVAAGIPRRLLELRRDGQAMIPLHPLAQAAIRANRAVTEDLARAAVEALARVLGACPPVAPYVTEEAASGSLGSAPDDAPGTREAAGPSDAPERGRGSAGAEARPRAEAAPLFRVLIHDILVRLIEHVLRPMSEGLGSWFTSLGKAREQCANAEDRPANFVREQTEIIHHPSGASTWRTTRTEVRGPRGAVVSVLLLAGATGGWTIHLVLGG